MSLHLNKDIIFLSVDSVKNVKHTLNYIYIFKIKKLFFFNINILNYNLTRSLFFVRALSNRDGILYLIHNFFFLEYFKLIKNLYLYNLKYRVRGLLSNFKSRQYNKYYKNISLIPPSAIILLNINQHFFEIKELNNQNIITIGRVSGVFSKLFNYNLFSGVLYNNYINKFFIYLFILNIFIGYKKKYLNIYNSFLSNLNILINSNIFLRYKSYSFVNLYFYKYKRIKNLFRKNKIIRSYYLQNKYKNTNKDLVEKKLRRTFFFNKFLNFNKLYQVRLFKKNILARFRNKLIFTFQEKFRENILNSVDLKRFFNLKIYKPASRLKINLKLNKYLKKKNK